MPSISFPWLDSGDNIELRPIPMAGARELQEMALRGAKAESARRNLSAVAMMNYIHAAAKAREKKDTAYAAELWNATMKSQGLTPLVWEVDEFDENLDAWIQARLIQPLGVGGLEEVAAALEAKNAEVNAEFEKYEKEIIGLDNNSTLVELYWHLHASDADYLTPRDQEPVRFDRSKAKREDIRDMLIECASLEDLAAIRKAINDSKREKPLDDDTFALTSPDVMRGKSEPEVEPSTKSSGDSPTSSEPTTVEETT